MFRDRTDAGVQLARRLQAYAGRPDVVVIALPRGGVPVGRAVADALRAPLDVLVVRKIRSVLYADVVLGAVAPGGIEVVDRDLVRACGLPERELAAAIRAAADEVAAEDLGYRRARAPLEVRGRTVIVVDDGATSGATMRAAIAALRVRGAKRIVSALPVASTRTCSGIDGRPDESVCCVVRDPVYAIRLWYDRFPPVTDDEVIAALRAADGRAHAGPPA